MRKRTLILAAVLAAAYVGACVGMARAADVHVTDGDTLRINDRPIRILGLDTAETRQPHCRAEWMAGIAAARRLRALLKDRAVTYTPDGVDRFRRTLATVYVDGRNVADILIAEGYGLRYTPGSAAKLARIRTWCGPGADFNDRWSPLTRQEGD